MSILLMLALLIQAEGKPPEANRKAQLLGDMADWFSVSTYPRKAKAARQSGRVATLVRVDEHGAVAGCSITKSSGFAPLDEGTCELIVQHLSFSPATDDAGKSIASDYPLHITWRLPGDSECTKLVRITPETTGLSQEEIDRMHLPRGAKFCR
nr:energy transducer TonB [uncultured Sphingomonas sp.]